MTTRRGFLRGVAAAASGAAVAGSAPQAAPEPEPEPDPGPVEPIIETRRVSARPKELVIMVSPEMHEALKEEMSASVRLDDVPAAARDSFTTNLHGIPVVSAGR